MGISIPLNNIESWKWTREKEKVIIGSWIHVNRATRSFFFFFPSKWVLRWPICRGIIIEEGWWSLNDTLLPRATFPAERVYRRLSNNKWLEKPARKSKRRNACRSFPSLSNNITKGAFQTWKPPISSLSRAQHNATVITAAKWRWVALNRLFIERVCPPPPCQLSLG